MINIFIQCTGVELEEGDEDEEDDEEDELGSFS